MKVETHKQLRASMLCIIAFTLGCIVVFCGGCKQLVLPKGSSYRCLTGARIVKVPSVGAEELLPISLSFL